jgi:hypothetical protein
MTESDFRKIAIALDKLTEDAVAVLHAQLDAENVPNSIRVPVWEALARRATEMAEECKKK